MTPRTRFHRCSCGGHGDEPGNHANHEVERERVIRHDRWPIAACRARWTGPAPKPPRQRGVPLWSTVGSVVRRRPTIGGYSEWAASPGGKPVHGLEVQPRSVSKDASRLSWEFGRRRIDLARRNRSGGNAGEIPLDARGFRERRQNRLRPLSRRKIPGTSHGESGRPMPRLPTGRPSAHP